MSFRKNEQQQHQTATTPNTKTQKPRSLCHSNVYFLKIFAFDGKILRRILVHPIVTFCVWSQMLFFLLPTEDDIFGGRRHFRWAPMVSFWPSAQRASFLFTELFQPVSRSWRKNHLLFARPRVGPIPGFVTGLSSVCWVQLAVLRN